MNIRNLMVKLFGSKEERMKKKEEKVLREYRDWLRAGNGGKGMGVSSVLPFLFDDEEEVDNFLRGNEYVRE